MEKVGSSEKDSETQNTGDLLKYRPNPDMLVSKTDMTFEVSQVVKVSKIQIEGYSTACVSLSFYFKNRCLFVILGKNLNVFNVKKKKEKEI